jgi:hypothetical protein
MRRLSLSILAVLALVAGVLSTSASVAAPPDDHYDVYVGEVASSQVSEIVDLGVDRHDLQLGKISGEKGEKAQVRVEAILSEAQAKQLAKKGVEMSPKKVDGKTAAEQANEQAADGFEVFKKYSGENGLKAEYEQAAAADPAIAKIVTIGQTVNGQDIIAMKVSKNARTNKDGKKPSVLYASAQHAREWITPEMNRRLMHHVIDNYGSDPKVTRLVDKNELWFVPVANPDGYDFTFEPDNRLWRKNLRDNNNDGAIAPGDGVDLNRNYQTKWGYDNEGSSPNTGSETYRGPSAGSEPETKALNSFAERIGFEFLVNYHSAAQLLLYGTGWQVSTPTPDDVIYEAMAGDDANPAVPGYDPDISAELYTTNGDTDTHMTEAFGTLGFTPEMSTCEAASDSVPDDEWLAEDCQSGFNFPDDEELIQTEFEKNIPFALSVAESAADPDDPASVVDRKAADFQVDSFDVSYGDPQTVAVVAKRALRELSLTYRINGGSAKTASVSEWEGGERYGDENDDYYAEFRGGVKGAREGDEVEVRFTGVKPGKGEVQSESFTYSVASDSGDDVLVLADEDYTGVNPDYPGGVTAPKYAADYEKAINDAGYTTDVWDIDERGVPHDLGVLGHYDAVVWYLGDNRLTQDPEDETISTPFGQLPDIAVAEKEQYTTMAVRDYMNSGGKLVHAGETAQYSGLPGIGDAVGGLFYGLNGDPEAECVVDTVPGFFEDCLIMADDFRQYYLGGFSRTDNENPASVVGTADPIDGFEGTFGGPVTEGDNPLNEAGVFQPTSDVLPVGEFPQFASKGAAEYTTDGVDPYAPVEGTKYAGALHQDASYMRLSKTVDMTGKSAGELAFKLSASLEAGYDHVMVEAHTVGQDNWTTLPEKSGKTTTTPPSECEPGGFLLSMHPFLEHYLGGAGCASDGTSGEWNTFTTSTDGWQDVAFDLAPYAGQQVELSITYMTDPGTGGIGAFVDDTKVTVDGNTTADGFEGAESSWTVGGPPEGSPPNQGNWKIGEKLVNAFGGVSTEDSLLLGFGLEQLSDDASRKDLIDRALSGLIG